MNFLFISELLPLDTYASEVVFYRHFIKLIEDGHNVHVVTDENSYRNRKKDLDNRFILHILPNRRWYFPPFRPYGTLQKIRFYFYYQYDVKEIISKYSIEKLFGYIHGNFLTAFSAYVQEKTKLPLISFFHDDTQELSFGKEDSSIIKNTARILAASTCVLIASNSFKESWGSFAHKFTLLFPIPYSRTNLSLVKAKPNQQSIGYSGSVYNEIIPSLDKFCGLLNALGFDLTIIGNNPKAIYLSEKYKEVDCIPLFDTALEATDYLIENCQICLIAYPEKVEEMPWIGTCFPSKFIQYCLIGLPTLIIAPENSAIGKWCLENKWALYTPNYEIVKIEEMLRLALSDENIKTHVQYLKNHIFNPEIIHKQFEKIAFS